MMARLLSNKLCITRMKAFQQVGHRHWGDDWDLPRRGKARLCSSTRWIFFFAVFFHLLVSSVQLDGTFYFLTLTLLVINSLLFSTQRISSLYWLQFEPTAWLTRCLLANSLRRPTRLGTRESSSLSSGCLCKKKYLQLIFFSAFLRRETLECGARANSGANKKPGFMV